MILLGLTGVLLQDFEKFHHYFGDRRACGIVYVVRLLKCDTKSLFC